MIRQCLTAFHVTQPRAIGPMFPSSTHAITALCVAVCMLTTTANRVSAEDVHIGVGKTVITPDVNDAGKPVWMAGFSPGRRATGVHDDLYVRVMSLKYGDQRVAIASMDFVGYFYDDVLSCRELLKKTRPDLADVHLVIASTHSHEGPDTMGIWGPAPLVSGVDQDYMQFVREQLVKTVGEAIDNAAPARVRIADAKTPNLVADSRQPKVINDTIQILHADRKQDNQPIGSLLLWHSHPEALGSDNTLLTADFPAYAIQETEAALGGTTVYLSGTVGGLLGPLGVQLTDEKTGAEVPRRTFEHAEQIGRRAARFAVAAIREAQPVDIDRLDVAVEQIDLPVGNPSFRLGKAIQPVPRQLYTNGEPDNRTEPVAARVQKDPELRAWVDRLVKRVGPVASLVNAFPFQLGEDLRTELNVITLGPAQFITIPGEIYPELVLGGIQDPQDPGSDFQQAAFEPPLLEMMPARYRFVIGLGNDELGYILPKSQWDVAPPYAYGLDRAQYGEIFSVGPETAGRIAEAYRRLLSP